MYDLSKHLYSEIRSKLSQLEDSLFDDLNDTFADFYRRIHKERYNLTVVNYQDQASALQKNFSDLIFNKLATFNQEIKELIVSGISVSKDGQEVESLLQNMEHMADQKEEFFNQRQMFEDQISQFQSELDNLNKLVSEKESKLKFIEAMKETEIKVLNTKLEKANILINKLEDKNRDLTTRLDKKSEEIISLKGGDKSEVKILKSQLEEFQDIKQKQEEEIELLNIKLREQHNRFIDQEKVIAVLTNDYEMHIKRLDLALKDFRLKNERLEFQLKEKKKMNAFMQELDKIDEKKGSGREQNNAAPITGRFTGVR